MKRKHKNEIKDLKTSNHLTRQLFKRYEEELNRRNESLREAQTSLDDWQIKLRHKCAKVDAQIEMLTEMFSSVMYLTKEVQKAQSVGGFYDNE